MGETMRLQKYLARAGVASRRACEGIIVAGRVTVNGRVADTLGTCVDAECDLVRVDGRVVAMEDAFVTIMLHKPAGYVTTMSDPQGRPCVADLVPRDRYPSLVPVGRLDRDTTGLLLFTTHGELANGLMHPRHAVWKRYLVLADGPVGPAAVRRLREGVEVDGVRTLPARVELLEGEDARRARAQIGNDAAASGRDARHGGKRGRRALERGGSIVSVEIREGRNRQVRRMFAAVGHEVVALHRAEVAGLALGDLARGTWRELSPEETAALYAAAGLPVPAVSAVSADCASKRPGAAVGGEAPMPFARGVERGAEPGAIPGARTDGERER